METKHTLVFGDDGSPEADIAWLFINNHPWSGWRLEVVTAEKPEVIGRVLPREETELHAWSPPNPRVAFTEAKFGEVVHLTAKGDPRVVLSRDCDLLVIGPRGPGLFKGLGFGSTADWFLNRPPAPLLIARHGHDVRNVVLCTDGSPHAEAVTTVLAGLPFVAQLQVTIVAVDDERMNIGTATESARRLLKAAGATVKVHTARGNPTAVIEDYLEQHSPDLVAIGTRGLTGLRNLRVGSTASAIARSAACSVLVACRDNDND